MNFSRNNELYHHGILGQKWGKKNGPPYPLDSSDHSAAEKKAGWRKSLNKESSSEQRNSKSAIALPKEKSDDDFKRDLLKKNPNAAVVNPDIANWVKSHKKEIAIGVGVAAIVAIGVAVTVKHKDLLVNNLPPIEKPKLDDELLKTPIKSVNQDYGGFDSKSERFMKAWFHADSHRFDAITPEQFAKMTSGDEVSLDVGAKMFRLSQGKHNTLRNGFEYVSISEEDRQRYKGFLPQMWGANGRRIREVFEAELSANVQIKAPGKKESIELMEAALKKAYPGHTDAVYRDDILRNFYRYQANLIDRSNVLGKAYAKELKAHGYNAMIDFNDAGRLSDKPLILINGAGSAKVNEVRSYTIEETRKAFKNIELPSDYSDFSSDLWDKVGGFARLQYERILPAYMKGV